MQQSTPSERLGDQFDDVLAAARAGSGWAFEALWRTLVGPVTGYARVQGSEHPDDIASEVFLNVFRGIRRFDGDEAGFRSWVLTIAHRRVIDERRRRGRRPRTEALDDVAEPVSVAPTPDDVVTRSLATDRVRQVCERLVPDQRDVLLLRLVGGMTVDEVAAAVGKSPGAVKALQRRGLLAVQKILQREGVPL